MYVFSSFMLLAMKVATLIHRSLKHSTHFGNECSDDHFHKTCQNDQTELSDIDHSPSIALIVVIEAINMFLCQQSLWPLVTNTND